MKKKKAWIFLVITLLVLLYVFVEAPTLSPLYLDGAIFWAMLITIYVGLNALMKIGEFSFDAEKTQPGQVPFSFSARQKFPKLSAVIIAVPWILIVVVMILCSVFFQWKAYRDQLGEPEIKKFDNEVQAIDVAQIPIVDENLALQLAQKKLGERPALGSQVALYSATIQMVDGELVWVVPLYHSGFFKWLTNLSGTPGYIVVSATNTNDVRYVEGYKIKYHPGSYLLFDITRKVRFGPGLMTGITDYSFELDDEGQPYWAISTYKNSRGFSLPEADGIILLNATTGQMDRYGMDEVPEWVDRVQPEDFVLTQIANRGNYVHGIFNFANKDKYRPSEGHNIVYNNGRCYLFTGLTSVGSDDSAIGFIMVDMVTKEPIMYEMSGATEEAAQRSAEGRVQDLKYRATFPIILNIDSQPTYFMTLKDNIGLIKQYAFVSVTNYSTVGTGESVSAAMRDYENKLRSDGVTTIGKLGGVVEQLEGTILRISGEYSGGNTVYKFLLSEKPNILFIAESTAGAELALTQPNDKIQVEYSLSSDGTAEVTSFDNLLFTQKAAS
ncbi:MAG: hypothetical protein KH509_04340 [Clostridium sp.]|nr:hypothetical protein [Clostridium sp.]CDA61467.1 uncharacterized protein BN513_01228 [Clostridium sp. CAG:169]